MTPRHRRIIALAAVNCLLLGLIIAIPMTSRATGQAGPGRATYSMAGGNVDSTDMGVLHVVDETHQEMVSLIWNDKSRTLTPIGYRNLAADSAGAGKLRP